jgi:hypothetical protein
MQSFAASVQLSPGNGRQSDGHQPSHYYDNDPTLLLDSFLPHSTFVVHNLANMLGNTSQIVYVFVVHAQRGLL